LLSRIVALGNVSADALITLTQQELNLDTLLLLVARAEDTSSRITKHNIRSVLQPYRVAALVDADAPTQVADVPDTSACPVPDERAAHELMTLTKPPSPLPRPSPTDPGESIVQEQPGRQVLSLTDDGDEEGEEEEQDDEDAEDKNDDEELSSEAEDQGSSADENAGKSKMKDDHQPRSSSKQRLRKKGSKRVIRRSLLATSPPRPKTKSTDVPQAARADSAPRFFHFRTDEDGLTSSTPSQCRGSPQYCFIPCPR
jgi:hypothetical protein